jgi:hypothetical protein
MRPPRPPRTAAPRQPAWGLRRRAMISCPLLPLRTHPSAMAAPRAPKPLKSSIPLPALRSCPAEAALARGAPEDSGRRPARRNGALHMPLREPHMVPAQRTRQFSSSVAPLGPVRPRGQHRLVGSQGTKGLWKKEPRIVVPAPRRSWSGGRPCVHSKRRDRSAPPQTHGLLTPSFLMNYLSA